MRRTIADLLADARAGLERVGPREAARAASDDGALLLDIRSELQRERDGLIPGALFHPRNVVEWRADPDFASATDLDGGFQAWRAAGLPIEHAV